MSIPGRTGMPRHLVGVWNPSYEADAMDGHVALLLEHARAFRAKQCDEEEVYVWWGKLRSRYRQGPLPHLGDVLALDEPLRGEEPPETHLYLTDYRSLYVAHLAEVTAEDVREWPGEGSHLPDYYKQSGVHADCWFRLFDIRRVVLDDTPAVIAELRHVRNVHYHDTRVSLYGGMVNLPLVVTREDGTRWFDPATRAQLTGGRHWVEFDAAQAGTGRMQEELREHRFGTTLWEHLDPAARGFIATAEQLYRAHRNDAAFDLSIVVVNFAKALEVQGNAVLRRALAGATRDVRLANLDGASVDLVEGGPFPLGTLARAIGEDQARAAWLRTRLVHGAWFTGSLPALLEEVRAARNPAAHGERVDRGTVARLRGQLVGVGSIGSLVELAKVRLA